MKYFKSRLFSLSAALCLLALMQATSVQAACPGSSPTAQAIAKADYTARASMALNNAKAEADLKKPKSPYEGCISSTAIDWNKFSNILTMDAIIKMIKDKIKGIIDQACAAARNATAMPGNMVNGVLQNGVSQVNNTINGAVNGATGALTAPINSAIGGATGGASNLLGQAGNAANGQINAGAGSANTIVNGVIP